MFSSVKILKPDVPPKRRRFWFNSLANLRLTVFPPKNFLALRNTAAEQSSATKATPVRDTAHKSY